MLSNRRFSRLLIPVLALSLSAGGVFAKCTNETPEQRDARMKWWREARFGLFIHWGLYAIPAGEWKGNTNHAEWIRHTARIPIKEYEKFVGQFNPVKFDADTWVRSAKEAGMKYLVITAKHHDGFSMFGSGMTDYDIVDATPFKRDPIKELAEACRKQGIRFGVYYSHSRDWYHRGPSTKTRPSEKYVRFVEGQLRELLTGYGPLSVIWFDTGDRFRDINTQYGELVRRLQPDCLISGRLRGEKDISDYREESDRRIPPRRVEGDVETPMTMRDNWGYDKDDDNWKTVKDLLERLVLCVSRGANMLLNVGPRPDGAFCPEETERLKAIGKWLRVNDESIYGTQASPFDFDFPWGTLTRKRNRLYLHVLKWPAEGLELSGLLEKPDRAWLLADPEREPLKVTYDAERKTTRVELPAKAPDPYVSVIVFEFKEGIKTDPQAHGRYHWKKGTGIKLRRGAARKPRRKGRGRRGTGQKKKSESPKAGDGEKGAR